MLAPLDFGGEISLFCPVGVKVFVNMDKLAEWLNAPATLTADSVGG